MYDQQIGRFHRIDRFTDSVPDFTPYHYANNNPVLYIDINGDSTSPAPPVAPINWVIPLNPVTVTAQGPNTNQANGSAANTGLNSTAYQFYNFRTINTTTIHISVPTYVLNLNIPKATLNKLP